MIQINTSKRPLVRIQEYFLFFMMYSLIGWCYEVFLEVVVYRWGFTNRGVLFGPWLPVYGLGALLFILFFHRVMRRNGGFAWKFAKPALVFLGCMAVATSVELAASYIMEYFTGSWPWQTYADYDINFQARIALSPAIRFGLGGLLFLFVLQPIFEKILQKCGGHKLNCVFTAVLAALLADVIYTFVILT